MTFQVRRQQFISFSKCFFFSLFHVYSIFLVINIYLFFISGACFIIFNQWNLESRNIYFYIDFHMDRNEHVLLILINQVSHEFNHLIRSHWRAFCPTSAVSGSLSGAFKRHKSQTETEYNSLLTATS